MPYLVHMSSLLSHMLGNYIRELVLTVKNRKLSYQGLEVSSQQSLGPSKIYRRQPPPPFFFSASDSPRHSVASSSITPIQACPDLALCSLDVCVLT